MLPFISIIIPCYNSGEFLPDAIESIQHKTSSGLYNVIIVDDGSTDTQTLNLLKQLEKQGFTIIYQENKGPAAARNTGVKASTSKYLLFLDSDNKIRPDYIVKALKVLESDEQIGVVYGKPSFFGDSSDARFITHDFNMYSLISGNYIDVCTVIRKEVWDSVGGFDEDRIIMGHEDWDFWLMAVAKGWKFHFIDEVLYDYRIRHDSVVMGATQSDKPQKVVNHLYVKHRELYMRLYNDIYSKKLFYEKEHKNPFRLFMKYLYHKCRGNNGR